MPDEEGLRTLIKIMGKLGDDSSKMHHIFYYFTTAKKQNATSAAQAIKEAGFDVVVGKNEYLPWYKLIFSRKKWQCKVSMYYPLDLSSLKEGLAEVESIANNCGCKYSSTATSPMY